MDGLFSPPAAPRRGGNAASVGERGLRHADDAGGAAGSGQVKKQARRAAAAAAAVESDDRSGSVPASDARGSGGTRGSELPSVPSLATATDSRGGISSGGVATTTAAAAKMPDWLRTREFMTHAYLVENRRPALSPSGTSVASLPEAAQESAIVSDMLFLFLGVDGHFIRIASSDAGDISFAIDPTLDPSLTDLVRRLLPIASRYVQISRAVDERTCRMGSGAVQHAMCEAVSDVLKSQHLVFVARLETQQREHGLSMQQLWYHAQSDLHTLETLQEALVATRAFRGGAALNALYGVMQRVGESDARVVIHGLLQRASVPFFASLASWVYRGTVQDPHDEFFVADDKSVAAPARLVRDPFAPDSPRGSTAAADLRARLSAGTGDSDGYWEDRFTLREEHVPDFIGLEVARRALQSGKYLNVAHDCGAVVDLELPTDSQWFVFPSLDPDANIGGPSDFRSRVNGAFRVSSRALLNLLSERYELTKRLRSVRHYLLLDQGDWFVHFMDVAGRELLKKVKDIEPERLRSMLEFSLRTSVANHDPFNDDVQPALLQYKILDQLLQIINVTSTQDAPEPRGASAGELTGLEAFALDYRVDWPLSLVLSRKAMTKYQLLFRHLFLCRFVERKLNHAWLLHKGLKEIGLNFGSGGAVAASFSLRHRMLHFIQQLQHYVAFEVIEPNSALLEGKIAAAETLDDVLVAHNDEFLDSCLKECLLTDKNLIRLLTKLLSICIIFSSFTEKFVRAMRVPEASQRSGSAGEDSASARHKQDVRRKVMTQQTRLQMEDSGNQKAVQKFDENFSSTLNELISRLRELGGAHTAGLALRLDFSGFYAKRAAEQRRAALERLGASLRPEQ